MNLAIDLLVEGGVPPVFGILVALVVGAFSFKLSIMPYIMGARQLGASRSQLLFSSSPFLGVLLAWLMFRETASVGQVGAGALMAAGIGPMFTARHAHEHAHEHEPLTHAHPHAPDLHHRHEH